jgi:hypothetical protein
MMGLQFTHIISFGALLYREINDGSVGGYSKVFKTLEVFNTFFYLGCIIASFSSFFALNLMGKFNQDLRHEKMEFPGVPHCTNRE